jgi:hypothetical protein
MGRKGRMAESFRIIPKKALEDVTTYKITHVHDYDIMVHPVSILKLYPIYSNITFPYHMTSGHYCRHKNMLSWHLLQSFFNMV